MTGDVVLTALLILPAALPVTVWLLFFNYPNKYWLAAIFIAFLVWIMRPSFRFHGRELTPEEAPRLFAEIQALRGKLEAPGRMQVMLDDSFNASAAETRGLLGLAGTRCALTLGTPLLAALSREQVIAIIAHELGHFSRRHGRLGHWLYRARVGWLASMQHFREHGSTLERVAAWYAGYFVPYFSTLCFVQSRQCEYEADADGASAVGRRAFARALCQLAIASRLWEIGFPRHARQWQRESPEAPADFYDRFAAAARDWPAGDLDRWLDEELRVPSGWRDTHPSLAERLKALGEKAEVTSHDVSAGSELLGDTWPTVLSEFNANWRSDAAAHWRIEHLQYRHIHEPLLAANETTVAGWSAEKRWARARALRAVKPADGLAELRALNARHPEHRGITFSYGAALLNENDRAGPELMERLATQDPTYRAPIYARLPAYHMRQGDDNEAELCTLRGERALERRGTAIATLFEKSDLARLKESSLPAEVQAVLSEAIRQDPTVVGYWLGEGEAPLATNESPNAATLRIHVLYLTVDYKQLQQDKLTDADVHERYHDALGILIPPNEQGIVRTYYTTENIPPNLVSKLSNRPGTQLSA